MIRDAREDFRDDLIGQIGRDTRDEAGNRFFDQVGLEVLDHLLRSCVGGVECRLADGVPDPAHRGLERAVRDIPGTSRGPADDPAQSVVGVRRRRHVGRLRL